jgi:iron(III) transport system permease protein
VIMAFALVMLFGRNGIVTNGLLDKALHLINAQTTNIYGMHGIVLAQLLTYGPVAYVVLHSALAQLDTRVEEAAENLGATRWDVFRKVTLPMSAPGLFQAALLIFALCLQDFGNPRVIGGESTMIAGVMYDQMVAFQNTNVASVLGIILIIPSLIVFVIGNIYLAKRTFSTKEPGGIAYIAETPRAARRLLEGACVIVSLFIAAMYATIIWGSIVKIWGQDNTLTLAYFTTKGISSAGMLEGDVGSMLGFPLILESVKTMGIAGVVGGLFAVIVGYVLSRTRSLFSRFSDFMIMLTVALPGVVFGIGYILAFNNPLGLPQLSMIGTLWIIILLIIFTRIYGGVTPTQAVLQKVDETVEEAATSLGASRVYTFRRVVFPTLRRPWLLGSLYIFVSGLVALGGVIFLTSAKFPLASVQIYILAEQGKYGLACSHSVYLIVVVLAAQFLIHYLEKQGDFGTAVVSAGT